MKLWKKTLSAALAIATIAGIVSTVPAVSAEEAGLSYAGTAITTHKGGYDNYQRTFVKHAFDFSLDRLSMYSTEPALCMDNRTQAEIVDGVLKTKPDSNFVIGSTVCLGDDYGLEEGYLSFDLKLTGGTVYLGVRTSKTAVNSNFRGIWFTFDGSDKMKIFEPESELTATVPMPVSLSEVKNVKLHEGLDTITLFAGDVVIAIVKYTEEGYLAFCGADGKVVSETEKSKIYQTGYFSLDMRDVDGYIDNLIFTNVEETRNNPESTELRLIDYSTWTATDDLDRTVADNSEAGAPKDNRYVGLFYFLCWVGAGGVVQDNTKLYLELGARNTKKYIENNGGEAYWAEPYFGYYRNTDTWVYRKHAYMLEQAGVDFIFLDVSNAEVFIPGHTALFDTWLEMRHEGIDTPQIVFFNGDTPTTFQSNMKKLFTTVYSDDNWDKYKELFFEWEGKPLIFGNYSGLSGDVKKKVDEKFTVRGSWAWMNKDNYWSWLQEYTYDPNLQISASMQNGGWGRNSSGKYESLSVALGHHPVTNKGRSFVNGVEPNNRKGDMEFSSIKQAAKGLCFESQFNAVQWLIEKNVPAEDPFVLMITGWNEWIAGCFKDGSTQNIANTTAKFGYVDQFNCEFSRDCEPMRNQDGYGFGDNYYYQMVDYIRQYKGINATPVADNQTSINIYNISSWDNIKMTYMDSLYDVEHRNSISYDSNYRYINNTGRNDFEYAKVSQDDNALYFLVKTSHDIIVDDGKTWMNLYINVDGDVTTGWEGFDYVLNRDRDSFVVTVEKFIDNTFESEVVGAAYYYLKEEYMSIKLSKSLLGVEGLIEKMIFKWADNSVNNGDPMGFMDLGDTAPDNRFGFLYLAQSCTTKEVPQTALKKDTGVANVNGTVITEPDYEINVTIGTEIVDVLYDLADVNAGLFVQNTSLAKHFEFAKGTSSCTAQVLKDDTGKYIQMKGYCDLRTWNDVEGSYEFSADIHMVQYGNSAIYIRGEMPGAYTPTNPRNFDVKQVFNYYEWDWYSENGGKTFGSSSTAGSGIGIYPGEESLTVRIKRYAPDGLGVASASYEFPYTDDFKPNEYGWFKLRAVDDGKLVTIYFDDIELCSIKLENPGVVYESDGTGQHYYGLATLCDHDGNQVLVVENTRINSEGSQVAMTTRNQTMEFRNMYIAYETQVALGGRSETPINQSDAKVEYVPDMRLYTTLSLEKEPSNEETTTVEDTESESETVVETESEKQETSQETESEQNRRGCKSELTISFVSMIALAGTVLFCKKNNEE